MGKGNRGEDPIEKARRKLDRAQLRLHVAEEDQVQARARGKQEVEAARLRAAQWQARAAERVEKRATALQRAEVQLQKALRSIQAPVVTPEQSVERLITIEAQVENVNGNGLALPDSSSTDTTASLPPEAIEE